MSSWNTALSRRPPRIPRAAGAFKEQRGAACRHACTRACQSKRRGRKTTTAINLGTALAAMGERVLIVDLDPQGNASTGLGIGRDERKFSTYDVLNGDASLKAVLRETGVPRLSIAPSTLDLVGLELEIAGARTAPIASRKRSRHSPKSRPSYPGRALHLCARRLPAIPQSFDHECDGGRA